MKLSTLAATTAAVTAAAGIGSVASTKGIPGFYWRLRKPPYQPPRAAFPIVWTTLYADIAATSAVTLDRLAATGQREQANRFAAALGLNLILNAGWTWIFFRFHKLGAAAIGAAVLTASSADLARRAAQVDARAGAALAPYPLWCAFATALSSHIWWLNR